MGKHLEMSNDIKGLDSDMQMLVGPGPFGIASTHSGQQGGQASSVMLEDMAPGTHARLAAPDVLLQHWAGSWWWMQQAPPHLG